MTTVDRLILSSLNWQWTKTNSSAKGQLPLKSPKGYKIMLDNIKASNLGVAGMLFVSMGRPRQPQQELPPWAVAATLPSQSQSESHNDESDTKSSKKLSLDKKLEPIMAALINKYPVGLCASHPDVRCFHYVSNDWHFELDKNCLNVWANAIDKCQMNDRVPLLGSNFFKKNQQIGYNIIGVREVPQVTAPAPIPPATAPIPPAVLPQVVAPAYLPAVPPPAYAYPGYMYPPYVPPPPLPGWPVYGYYPPPPSLLLREGPIPSSSTSADDHALSSPLSAACGVEEFCDKMGLKEVEHEGLKRLGFHVGDKLDDVQPTDWKEAGFCPLKWNRVVRAEKKFRKELKALKSAKFN
ncbi:predicted protein [Postia placenta Mad-698-R]|nr:predicted protein [Postia placenta Mad-698-R]